MVRPRAWTFVSSRFRSHHSLFQTKNIPKPDLALPSEDSTCAICDDSEGENSNAIVFCDGCNLAVHQGTIHSPRATLHPTHVPRLLRRSIYSGGSVALSKVHSVTRKPRRTSLPNHLRPRLTRPISRAFYAQTRAGRSNRLSTETGCICSAQSGSPKPASQTTCSWSR